MFSARLLATHSTRMFPLHFPYRASPRAITFQLSYTTYVMQNISEISDRQNLYNAGDACEMHTKLWLGTAMVTTILQIPLRNPSSIFKKRKHSVYVHTLLVINSHKTVWLDVKYPKANAIKRADMLCFNPDFAHSFLWSAVTHPPSQVVFKARVFSGIPSYPQGRQGKSRTNEMFKPLMTRGGGHLVSHLTHATQGKLLHFLWYNSFQKFGALSVQIRALHVMKTGRSTNYRNFISSV